MAAHTNFDAAELEKFQALASRWWDPESEFWPLHAINPRRLEWIDGLGVWAAEGKSLMSFESLER